MQINKWFRHYLIIWAVLLILYNLIVFLVPESVAGYNRFEGAFWPAYLITLVAFLAQLACAWYALKENAQKTFYRYSFFQVSVVLLLIMAVVGMLCMAFSGIPVWITILVCFITAAVSVITLVMAHAGISAVAGQDEKTKMRRQFLEGLTSEVSTLLMRTSDPKAKAAVQKIYDTARFSDPMSAPELAELEAQIGRKFGEVSTAAKEDDPEKITALSEELIALLKERNTKCRLYK